MANIKKTAFTLGVTGMTLMPMKSIAQNQERKYENFYAAMRSTVNNAKYAKELAKPWKDYKLQRDVVEFDSPPAPPKYKTQKNARTGAFYRCFSLSWYNILKCIRHTDL